MKPRVLLVKPPERSGFNFGAFSLGVLAAAVRDIAEVSILDATDLSLEKTIGTITNTPCDWIGITVMGLKSVVPVAELVRRLQNERRQERPGLVVGGHGASMLPGPLLQAGADLAVIGEGELTFRQILNAGAQTGAAGCACLVQDQVVVGPVQDWIHPLDRLNPPARDLMPAPRDGIHMMETSRGCPHACAFCETTRFYGRHWRAQSPEKVAGEVRRLVEDYEAWIIHIADDNFTASPRRVRRICEAVLKGPLPAFFMVSARADDLVRDPDLLPAMAAARILRVQVGVETLDPSVAARVDKPITLETYRTAFDRMRQLGIFSVASFIVGLPGESEEARRCAVEMAIEAGPDAAHFLPFLPLPGIPLSHANQGFDPRPEDVEQAEQLNCEFLGDARVRARLATGAQAGGIRGLLCQGTLEKHENIGSFD